VFGIGHKQGKKFLLKIVRYKKSAIIDVCAALDKLLI